MKHFIFLLAVRTLNSSKMMKGHTLERNAVLAVEMVVILFLSQRIRMGKSLEFR
jgi:hypothetical protein